jgi:cell division transport system permease protein
MFKNISKERSFFFSSLISLVVVFVLIDIFIFTVFNINEFRAKMENSNQIIVYAKTMTEEEISVFQGKLLKTPGVQTLKYESKETALQKIEKELNVDLSEEENPLSDSFYVYVSKNAKIEKMQDTLLSFPEVEELDMRAKEIEKTNKFSKSLNYTLLFGSIGLLVFGLVLIYNLTSFGIKARKRDILDLRESGVSKLFIKFTYFLEGVLLIVLSSGLGFLVFRKLQNFIVQGINILNANVIAKSTTGELISIFLMSLLLGILITLFVNFVAMNGYYRDKNSKLDSKEIKNN